MGALIGADPAAFADIKICLEPGGFFRDALGGAKYPAGTAFHAVSPHHYRPYGSPVAGLEKNKFG
jgi:hypothetical protein